jgi:hypothetical protein
MSAIIRSSLVLFLFTLASFSAHATLAEREDFNSYAKADSARVTFSEEIAAVHLTGYSARCKGDPWGGANRTSWGELQPRAHTLDGVPKQNTVIVAAPQSRGTASLFGCYVEFDFSRSNVPKSVRKLFEGKQVFVGDHYDPRSDGLKKFDISLECTSARNIAAFNYRGVIARKTRCLGTSVTAQARGLPEPDSKPTATAQTSSDPLL